MTIFITGAAGFLGGALTERVRRDGRAVVGADRVADPAAGIVAGDVGAPGPWQDAFAGCEVVLHTAAVVSNAVPRREQWRVNVLGTRHALDAAVRAGASRFVLFSSVRAFGDLGWPDGVDEAWPVQPDGNAYVDTKVAAEQVALQAHAAGEIEVVVVRPGDVYGPGSRPWTVLPVELMRAGRFVLPAGGRGVFSPVFVDDLIEGVLRAADAPGAAGQVITLASGTGVPCSAFFGHYSRLLGRDGPRTVPTPLAMGAARVAAAAARITRTPSELHPDAVRYFTRTGTYSIAKAGRLLDWRPRVTLEQGMERTAAWLVDRGLVPAAG